MAGNKDKHSSKAKDKKVDETLRSQDIKADQMSQEERESLREDLNK